MSLPPTSEPINISECYKAIQGALYEYANACSLDGKRDSVFSRQHRWDCQAKVEKYIRQLVRMAEHAEYRETCLMADKKELIEKIRLFRDKLKDIVEDGHQS